MKKLLLLATLLIGLLVRAQDYNYLTSLNRIANESDCVIVAQNMALLVPKKVRLLKAKDFPEHSFYSVRFVPEEMTNEQYDALDKEAQAKLLTVRFYYWNEGENKNLELAGTRIYKFNQVTGSYLSLFPIWQKYIKPDADLVKTQESSSNSFRDIEKKLYYLLQDEEEIWNLRNRS